MTAMANGSQARCPCTGWPSSSTPCSTSGCHQHRSPRSCNHRGTQSNPVHDQPDLNMHCSIQTPCFEPDGAPVNPPTLLLLLLMLLHVACSSLCRMSAWARITSPPCTFLHSSSRTTAPRGAPPSQPTCRPQLMARTWGRAVGTRVCLTYWYLTSSSNQALISLCMVPGDEWVHFGWVHRLTLQAAVPERWDVTDVCRAASR